MVRFFFFFFFFFFNIYYGRVGCREATKKKHKMMMCLFVFWDGLSTGLFFLYVVDVFFVCVCVVLL